MPAHDPEPTGPRPGTTSTNYALINGCEISDDCLQCPLTFCQFDDARKFHRTLRSVKGELMRQERNSERLTVAQVAERYGLAAGTVRLMLSLPTDPMGEDEAKVLTRIAREQLDAQRRPHTP